MAVPIFGAVMGLGALALFLWRKSSSVGSQSTQRLENPFIPDTVLPVHPQHAAPVQPTVAPVTSTEYTLSLADSIIAAGGSITQADAIQAASATVAKLSREQGGLVGPVATTSSPLTQTILSLRPHL